MTRAMLVTVLWRSAGSPNEGTNGFTDVPADQWYTQAVAWAAQNGIVNGVGSNKFDPDAKITREQLAAVLYRYAGKVGMDVTARADLKLFPDAGSVSAYATDALSWCVANGIVNGTLEHGTAYLDPQGSATRAQVCHAHVPLSQAHGSITEKSLRPSNRAASCFFCCNALY